MLTLIAEAGSNSAVWGGAVGLAAFLLKSLDELFRTQPARARASSLTCEVDDLEDELQRLKNGPGPGRTSEGNEEIAGATEALRELVAVMSSTDDVAVAPPSKTAKALQELLKELEARSLQKAGPKRSDPEELGKALESLVRTLIERQEGASREPA